MRVFHRCAVLILILWGLGTGSAWCQEPEQEPRWEELTEEVPKDADGWYRLGKELLEFPEKQVMRSDGDALEGTVIELPDGSLMVKTTATDHLDDPHVRVDPDVVLETLDLTGGPRLAVAALQKALALNPDHPRAHNSLAIAHLTRARVAQAERAALKEIRLEVRARLKTEPDSSEVTNLRQVAERAKQRREQLATTNERFLRAAEEAFKGGIRTSSKLGKADPALMANLGNLYATELKDYDEAVGWLRRAAMSSNGYPFEIVRAGDVRMTQAYELFEEGRRLGTPHERLMKRCRPLWTDAEDYYRSFLRSRPQNEDEAKLTKERLEQVERFLEGRFD